MCSALSRGTVRRGSQSVGQVEGGWWRSIGRAEQSRACAHRALLLTQRVPDVCLKHLAQWAARNECSSGLQQVTACSLHEHTWQ